MKRFFPLILMLLPGFLQATSTSGPTMRALNIDGFVALGGVPGNNTTFWETDEVLQGFMGSVNWHMTWDDTNLYLGRTGGNNLDGTVVYIRADYPGATFSNLGFDYDGLRPDVSPMGGINFAAYLKDTPYDEFRIWNGSLWSAPNTSLVPFYSTQLTTDHMEVAIPWNSVTGGNGKPSNVRMLLYQVVDSASNTSCTPPAEFVYAESPWGTGNVNDGPSIGVNDGVPTSSRQPAGCDAGDSTVTRWWGCFPVTGGVGANSWIAQTPDAGPDTSICETATAYVMQGNVASANAVGSWALISQPAGSSPVTIADPNNAGTLVQNLDGVGQYVFAWDINYGGCPSKPDTVVITRYALPPTAVVGPDQILPCGLDSALIFAFDPSSPLIGQGGTGQWVLVSGQGAISSPNDTMTWVTALGLGDNIFEWQISNGPCQVSSAQVSIRRFAPVFADAGPDQDLCEVSIASLAGNDPIQLQLTAIGNWSQASGPTQAVFTNSGLFNSNVSNLTNGTYVFEWTVVNGSCPPVRDSVVLTIFERTFADAGGDQFFCAEDVAGLEGNNPLSIAPTATGVWRQLSGASMVEFADSTVYNTTIENLEDGIYKFAWIVRNGPCVESADVLSVFVTDLQNDGLDTIVPADPGQFNGQATLNPAVNGTPPFMYSLDGNSWQSSPTFSSLAPGTYLATLMDDFGCLDSLTFEVGTAIPPPPPKDSLLVTTGFSPNGDGKNDTWVLPGIDNFPAAVVEIYNAWGGLVFRSEGAYSPWNGTHNGKLLPPATYFFIIDLKTDGETVRKGSLSLFR